MPGPIKSSSVLPNLGHLLAFCEVVRRGSVTAAARAVHVTQPAVTQAVSSVERALGARLFQRTPTGLRPTQGCLVAVDRVKRAISLLRDSIQGAQSRARASRVAALDPLRGIRSAQLTALVAVVQEGAFAPAARSVGLTRATVHRAVRQLERTLGVALLEATSFGVRPTREAERLAVQAQLAFAEVAQARAEIAADVGTGTGATVIGAMPLARSVLVPHALIEFSAQYPGHAISILDGPYDSMLSALRCGGADVLIGALREPAPADDVVQEHLFDDPLAIIMRAKHPLAAKRAPTVRELAGYSWIAPRAGSPLRARFDELLRNAGTRAAVAAIECNSLIAARAILLASDRLMLLSAHQIQHELGTGQLVALPHPQGHVVRSIGLTIRRDWRPTQVQLSLLDALRRHARAAARGLRQRGPRQQGKARRRRRNPPPIDLIP